MFWPWPFIKQLQRAFKAKPQIASKPKFAGMLEMVYIFMPAICLTWAHLSLLHTAVHNKTLHFVQEKPMVPWSNHYHAINCCQSNHAEHTT